jgi:hypothetical protein
MTVLVLARCFAELKEDRLWRTSSRNPPPNRRGVLTLPRRAPCSGVGDNQLDGSGSAVVDLIFSMAKRDVTFFTGMAAMSCL